MYFRYFVFISPWKRAGPFIWTNLNPLHPRMLCAKFDWKWVGGSGEEDFSNIVNVFSLFRNYFPFGIGWGPSFEQTWIPFTQGCYVPSLVELAQWFWRRRWKCEKFTTTPTTTMTTTTVTDKFWSEKLAWAFGSGELKKKTYFLNS